MSSPTVPSAAQDARARSRLTPPDRAVRVADFLEKARQHYERLALPVPVGIDAVGNFVLRDLRELGHVLITGATGSGKSMFYHTTLCSWLQKYSPGELRLFLADLKMVELLPYDGIPHLFAEVVTPVEKCFAGLSHLVEEKNRRLQQLERAHVDNIEAFNTSRAGDGALPYLIVVVDTFSDLIYHDAEQLEQIVWSLTSDATRAGIHVMMCDSRAEPRAFTDTIKSCFPTRIAFRTVTEDDSRVILGIAGAEKLLGHGDMLFWHSGMSAPARVQAPYISAKEMGAIIAAARSSNSLR